MLLEIKDQHGFLPSSFSQSVEVGLDEVGMLVADEREAPWHVQQPIHKWSPPPLGTAHWDAQPVAHFYWTAFDGMVQYFNLLGCFPGPHPLLSHSLEGFQQVLGSVLRPVVANPAELCLLLRLPWPARPRWRRLGDRTGPRSINFPCRLLNFSHDPSFCTVYLRTCCNVKLNNYCKKLALAL